MTLLRRHLDRGQAWRDVRWDWLPVQTQTFQMDGDGVRFRGLIAKPDGSEWHAAARSGARESAVALARDAAGELKARGGAGFFAG